MKWGYLARQIDHVRYRNEMITKNTYDLLRDLLKDKPKEKIFVATTNADGLTHRNSHYDFETQVCELQGTYSKFQCLKPCKPDAFWDARPELDRLLAGLQEDGRTNATPPQCPHCGGPSFLNVRGGDWFLEEANASARARFESFKEEVFANATKCLILELGCGYNTPTVLRIPDERLAIALGERGTLVRVSFDHAHLHHQKANINAIMVGGEDLHSFLEKCVAEKSRTKKN